MAPHGTYNPFTATVSGTSVVRGPILNNQLKTAGPINPVTQNYFNLIPLPNNTTGAATDGPGNYVSGAPSISSATASNFGYITTVYANSQPRQVQLGARLVF